MRAESSIPKPSVPQFTVKFVDSSYDVPTSYSIDPYTGANVTQPSHHVENRSIELTINNQPFTPVWVQEGTSNWTAHFYYNVRVKGHYAENWTTLYIIGEGPTPSNSDYTVISYQLTLSPTQPDQGYTLENRNTNSNSLTGLPPNSQIDFQVEAMIGAAHRGYNPDATDQLQMFPWVFDGEESGWSNTQTVTISDGTSTATPSTSPSSTTHDTISTTDQPDLQTSILFGLDWVQVTTVALLGVIAVLLAVVVVYLRKRSLSKT